MRTIAIVTAGRSDFGLYRSVIDEIQAHPGLSLRILATGSHLLPAHGNTIEDVRNAGCRDVETVEMLLASDSPEAIAKSMGLGVLGFAQAYARRRPDLLLVLGDRFEMFAATAAAVPFAIPIAHIHGGEVTEGAIDEQFRHAITKMSHLHFASTEAYAERITRMGEEPWRVVVSGAPGLDCLSTTPILGRDELEAIIGISLDPAPILVTYHPESLQYADTQPQIEAVLEALRAAAASDFAIGINAPADDRLRTLRRPIVLTMPNADTHSHVIREALFAFTATTPNTALVASLGTSAYFSLMRLAAVMVGNSSSGIIEAASFGLPVVNIGDRQAGRIRAENVIDVPCTTADIAAGIALALSPPFREKAARTVNPYGRGNAAARIVDVLATVELGSHLLRKRYYDGPDGDAPGGLGHPLCRTMPGGSQ